MLSLKGSAGFLDDSLKPETNWRELKTENEIRELMDLFAQFHDGCIREIHIATGHFVEEDLSMTCHWPTTLTMLVQRQRREPSALELKFEEVVELRMSPPSPNYDAIIWNALFVLQDGIFIGRTTFDGTWIRTIKATTRG